MTNGLREQACPKVCADILSRKILRLFRAHSNRRFILVNHAGNYGDDLIYRGGEKIARLAGVNYCVVTHPEFMALQAGPEDVVYIQGGGSFAPFWCGDVLHELAKGLRDYRMVIVGPQTFFGDETYLRENLLPVLTAETSAQVHIFTRELVSLEFLKKIVPPHVHLDVDHDTALNLTMEDFGEIRVRRKYRYYAIRRDKEARAMEKFDPFLMWSDPIPLAKDFADWLDLHAGARELVTNRLHSAIVGTLLKKQVTLLPNSYHKNRAVWEYSLRERGVIWADDIAVSRPVQWMLRSPLYRQVVNSYKLGCWVYKYHHR